MSDIIGVIAVLLAITCMYLAQAKTLPKRERKHYALLGSAASAAIAVEAGRRGELGVCLMFAGAAAVSLLTLALDYLNPGNPDA